jgi:hypothetical protein
MHNATHNAGTPRPDLLGRTVEQAQPIRLSLGIKKSCPTGQRIGAVKGLWDKPFRVRTLTTI